MHPTGAQERKAHTYQNTTHGRGVCLVHIMIHYPFAVVLYTGFSQLGIVSWLLTILYSKHPTHKKHNKKNGYGKGAYEHISIHLHEGAWVQLVFVGVEQGI